MCTKCEWHKEWMQRVTHPWLAVMNDSPHRTLLQPQLWLTQPTNKDDTWQLTMLVKIPAIPPEDKKLGVCLLLPSPQLSPRPLSLSFYFSIFFLFSLSRRTTWGAQALFFKLGLWLVQLLGLQQKALASFFFVVVVSFFFSRFYDWQLSHLFGPWNHLEWRWKVWCSPVIPKPWGTCHRACPHMGKQ